MKLFIVGPTEIEQDILELGALPQVYMRTPAFSNRLHKIYENLQYVFQTKNPVFMFAASGTGSLNAACNNFVNRGDKVIVINGGSFGHRWVELNERAGANVVEAKVEFGKSINPQVISDLMKQNPDTAAVFATLDETSSGALTDVKSIGKILKDYPNTLFIVDCVSALIIEPFYMDEWGVDVATTASQKALAIPSGLCFMAVSDKAMAKAETVTTRPYYFDVLEHLKDWKRDQTPFTPAISLIYQLERRLEKIKTEGLENLQKRYFDLTNYLRDKMAGLGFTMIPEHPSNCVSAYWSGKYDAKILVKELQERYEIEIAPSGGDLATKMFRIGNFGNINKNDIDDLVNKIQTIISEI